jgi:hypothetical protein
MRIIKLAGLALMLVACASCGQRITGVQVSKEAATERYRWVEADASGAGDWKMDATGAYWYDGTEMHWVGRN